MSSHILVLDANILVRAVLGNKVRNYLIDFNESVDFFIPDICVEEAQKYLPIIFDKRKLSTALLMDTINRVIGLLQIIDKSIYQERATDAQRRMNNRDIQDWPAVATSLLFNCPIWTEDKDFFGVGIPVWTSDTIHIFFESVAEIN